MYRILLVDDSRVTRRMLQDMLSTSGFADCELLEAIDGEDSAKITRNYSVDAVSVIAQYGLAFRTRSREPIQPIV
jgi:CheY-like chemotaxis protein